MKIRSRALALGAALTFFVQAVTAPVVFAQSAAVAGSTYDGTASANSMQSTSTATAPVPVVPEANVQGAPLPSQPVISPDLQSVISNGVTSSGNVVIDFGTLPGGVLDHGTNNFINTGTIYAISTNPAITTATLQAQNIYNQSGATISTIAPAAVLAQYANVVSSLNLVLNATQNVVNAGVISSAGNLTVNAGASIINALPSTLASTTAAAQPVMQAVNNVNLNSALLANAGLIQSIASNINIASATFAATQNVVFNNVGGTLSALQGAVNVRDAAFSGKVNTALLGGDVLSRELNLYSGNGLLDVQVGNLTGGLRLRAGDGFLSALSDINVIDVVWTGDPIVKSGGNIIFQSDIDPLTGEKTGICTGGGQFEGTDALIASDVRTINISGAILQLSGSALLNSLPITSASSLVINAGGNINVSDVGAGSAIILKSSGGSVNAGTLSAGDFIQLEAPGGNVNSGDLSSQAGGVRVVAQDMHVGAISAVSRPGFVDIKAQTAGPFIVGTSSDSTAPPPNIRSITMTGSSPTGNAWVNIDNPNGVTISSASAVTISTAPSTFSGLSLNAQSGTVTLPSGNMIFRGGNFAVSANSIVANGTIIDTSSTAGPGGLIFLGATILDRGAGGLTLNTDGTNNLGSGIGIGGKQSVAIVTQFDGVNNSRFINYSGTVAAPFSLTGSGNLTATSKGTVNGGNIFIDSSSTATLSGGAMTFNADGVDGGNGGFVQMFNSQIVNNVSSIQGIKLSANGSGNGNGGFAQAVANSSGANLTLRPGTLTLSATSGSGSGNGGTIDTKAGGTLFVDPSAISIGAVGLQGNGQRLTMVGGTTGQAGGGLIFTKGGTLVNEGKGSGFGGLVQIGAFGTDNDLRYSAQVGTQTELVNVSVQGGAVGSGGTIQSDAGRNMALDGSSLRASAGTSGNGNGGLVDLKSGKSGIGTMTVTGGNMEANGSGTGAGGLIRMVNFGQGLSIDPGTNPSIELKATGVRGDGGTVVLQSYGDVTLNNTAIDVQGGKSGNGNGGFVEIDSGFSGTGNLNATTSIIADGGGTGNGGTIIANSLAGDANFNHPGDTTVMSVQGGEGGPSGNGGFIRVLAAKDLNLQSGDVEASSLAASGNGGTIILGAGTSGAGRLVYNQKIHANSGTVAGNCGQIFLSEASPESILISGDIQANALTDGASGDISYQNLSTAPLFVEISGNLSADSVSGMVGTHKLIAASTQDVIVRVKPTGIMSGPISATNAHSVDIRVDAAPGSFSRTLDVKEIRTFNGGTVTLRAETINIPSNGIIVSSGNVLMFQDTLTLNGSVETSGPGASITLNPDSTEFRLVINGNGTFTTNNANIVLESPEQNLSGLLQSSLEMSGQLHFSPGSGTVRFGSQGFWALIDLSAGSSLTVNSGSLVMKGLAEEFHAGSLVEAPSIDNRFQTLQSSGTLKAGTTLTMAPIDMNVSGSFADVTLTGLAAEYKAGTSVQFNSFTAARFKGSSHTFDTPATIINASSVFVDAGTTVRTNSAVAGSGRLTFNSGFVSNNGSIDSASGPLQINNSGTLAPAVTVEGTGSLMGDTVRISSRSGAVMVSQSLIQGRMTVESFAGISLTTNQGGLTLQRAVTSTGSVSVTTSGGALGIMGSLDGLPNVSTLGGSINLRTPDASLIHLSANSNVQALSGAVTIVSGSDSGIYTTTPPPNILVTGTTPQNAQFSASGIAAAPPDNIIDVNGGSVTIVGGAGLVTFGGNAKITSSTAFGMPPSRGGDPPGQVHQNPASTNQNPGQSNGAAGPPGQNLFVQPGLILNPANPSPPGQQQTPPGQQKKAKADFPDETQIAESDSLLPVSFMQMTIPLFRETQDLPSTSDDALEVYCLPNSSIARRGDAQYKLLEGSLIVSARKHLTITTNDVTIDLKKGTIAILESEQDRVTVRNLTDRRHGSTTIQAGNKVFRLEPGQGLTLAKNQDMLIDRVSLRCVQRTDTTSWQSLLYEYSLPSLCANNELARRAISSATSKLSNRIMKTHACLTLVTSKHGPYREP